VSIVALASAKGSPGVSTTALALASRWPRQVVLIEADPAGGDLAARTGLAEEPGLVGLAAALRRNRPDAPLNSELLEHYQQRAPIGVEVVAAPAASQQAAAAVTLLAAQAARPSSTGGDLLVDLGRVAGQSRSDAGPASQQMSRAADLVVWVCRPELADLAHVAATLGPKHSGKTDAVIVLCGEGPYPAHEVSATLGRPVLGSLPADNAGAAALWAGGARSWAHSALGRATRDLAEALVGRLPDDSGAQAAESPETPSGRPGSDDSNEPVHTRRSDAETIGAGQ
jgi:MinD-like ATPase involved in chromosome partitioning or flagellar assembly